LVVSKSVRVAVGSPNNVAQAPAFGVPGHHAATKRVSPGAGAPLSESSVLSAKEPAKPRVGVTGNPTGMGAAFASPMRKS
jgi:hypothetical protein